MKDERKNMDYSKMTLGALKDMKSMAECALIRAEVNEDIEKYKRMYDKLDRINSEIEKRRIAHK